MQLVEDLLGEDVPPMNKPFRDLQATLKAWKDRAPGGLQFHRVEAEAEVDPGENVRFPGRQHPRGGARSHDREPSMTSRPCPSSTSRPEAVPGKLTSSYSASHTINGHSIVLRIVYGNVRLLLCGDLNQEAMKRLVERFGDVGSGRPKW